MASDAVARMCSLNCGINMGDGIRSERLGYIPQSGTRARAVSKNAPRTSRQRAIGHYKSAIADSYGASCQARSISATAVSSDSLSAAAPDNVSAPSAVRRRSITQATVFSGLGEGSTCKTANEKTMASEAATSIAAVQRRRERCSATWANDSAAAARSISARRGGDRAMPSSSRPFTKSSISRYSFISTPPTSLSILASQYAST